MPLDNDKLKKLVNEFTSLTIGVENPEGMSFLTCFPISILLDLHQIDNSISYGVASRNNSLVNHCWLTLDSEGTILDPTIRQFDLNMESTYIGKLDENDITKYFEPINEPVQDCFDAAYNIWAEPLINKQPRTIRRESGFEFKMNLFNVKTAAILNSYISKMENRDQIMSSFKCQRYFSPIFKFLNEKSNSHDTFISNLKQEVPKEFNLLVSRAPINE
jgi:hypothetical protein